MKIQGQKPEARSFHSAVSVGNKLVVIGGRGTQNQHFADVHVFDCGSYSVLGDRFSRFFSLAKKSKC